MLADYVLPGTVPGTVRPQRSLGDLDSGQLRQPVVKPILVNLPSMNCRRSWSAARPEGMLVGVFNIEFIGNRSMTSLRGTKRVFGRTERWRTSDHP